MAEERAVPFSLLSPGQGDQPVAMPSFDISGEEALAAQSFQWPGRETATRGFAATVFNLASTTVGAGVLTTGYLFRQTGWLTAFVMLFVGASAAYTAKLIPRCLELAAVLVPECERCGEPLDWPVIGQAAMGRAGTLLVKLVQWGELMGCVLSFLVFQGGILSTLIPLSKSELTAFSGSLMALMLLMPPEYLSYFSFLGIVGIFMVEGSALASGLALPELPDASQRKAADWRALPEVVSIVLFLYIAHAELPSIFLPMQRKRLWPRASELAFAICALLYVSTGSVMYYFYADQAQENLTENVGHDLGLNSMPGVAWLQPLTSVLFAAKLQVTFPLFTPPLTDACEGLLGFTYQTGKLPRMLVKVAFAAACTVIAVILQELGNLTAAMTLTGYIFSTSTTLILPTAFYLKLTQCQLHWSRILLCALILLTGVVIMIAGLWNSADQAIASMHRRSL